MGSTIKEYPILYPKIFHMSFLSGVSPQVGYTVVIDGGSATLFERSVDGYEQSMQFHTEEFLKLSEFMYSIAQRFNRDAVRGLPPSMNVDEYEVKYGSSI